jgi:DedD protein
MAKQIITDEEAKLKRQARRRLFGAVALTILIVTLLPMLLDKEPPAPNQNVDLQIPDKDKAGEFVPKMVLPPSNTSEAASQPSSAPVIAPLLDASKPATASVPAQPAKGIPAAEAAKPAEARKPAESPAQNKAQATKPATEKKHEAAAEHKAAAKPVAKQSSKTHKGFVVQVAAFSNAESARKLQEKLHAQGYANYTEKAGEIVRVRVGDFATHAEAEKIQRKLEIQGQKPNIINLNQ